jgi:hypothetical protein
LRLVTGLAFAKSELRPAPHPHTTESLLTPIADSGQDTKNPAVAGLRISATGHKETVDTIEIAYFLQNNKQKSRHCRRLFIFINT